MMMSIFSSFDALSAELFGQKLSLSRPPITDTKQQQGVGTVAASDHKNVASPPTTSSSTGGLIKKNGEVPPPSSSRQQQQKRQRFALEFDGVNCFETIIPY
ncbi:hypothetical protein P3S67_006902 [Capsicum chacoense]|uniref:uncharacterized protein LOC107866090 n=1 Tax=Capsicum annuum TaxID=4072 RepID=UPI0007BEC21A|nr:uncharacterized protein LOC107866090 [Capsicum annuum]KAF3634095.1 putative pre-mRNA-splicing factor SF2 isoform X1 [Capsicum annuum]KAF3677146.1 putative pre-mRNA-splicing factor SF2 isoform X1 [Capsicum annuum]